MATCASYPLSGTQSVDVGIGFPDGTNTDGTMVAIPFTPSFTCVVSSVTDCVSFRGTPAGTLTAKIFSDSGGLPGTALATSSAFSGVTTTPALQSTAITGITVNAGTQYWLVMNMNATASSPNCFLQCANSTGTSYNAAINISGSWTSRPNTTWPFSIDGTAVVTTNGNFLPIM